MSNNKDIFPWNRVETFIGRIDYINSLLPLIQDGKFHLVTISGGYGYGKTRLLKELLVQVQNFTNVAAPLYLIDLYRTETHSPQGLADAIVTSFGEKYPHYFEDYQKHKNERDQLEDAGSDSSAVQKEEKAMLDACATGLKELSTDRSFALLFDTTERWVYSTLSEFKFSEKAAPALDWLLETCHNLDQGVVVLAGRPEIGQLDLPDAGRLELKPFSEEDIDQYLRETCGLMEKEFGLAPITLTPEEIRKLNTLSEGRPILLALFLERILHGDQSIRTATAELTPAMFESVLVNHLVVDSNIGELLRFAGRAPKGVTLEMLSLMTGSKKEEISKGFETLKVMSFAKTFEGDDHLFLHEEMYSMLGRHIYRQSGDDVEADRAAQGLYKFYKENTSELQEEIGRLYVAYAAKRAEDKDVRPLRKQIAEKKKTLQMLDAEFAFYRWRRAGKKKNIGDLVKEDPIEMGLRRYYRIAHEAAASNDYQMLVWLRFELIRFINDLRTNKEKGYKQSWLPFLQGFMYVQEVWEINASNKPVSIATEIEQRMLPGLYKIDELSAEQNQVLAGILKIWMGMAYLYNSKPSYAEAEKAFNEVINSLTEKNNTESNLAWFLKTTLVLAYRQRAYLKKRQYALNDAIRDYKKAAKINRALDFNFEEAHIRNDLGDSQVQIGDFDNAKLNLNDAFDLRRKMKNGARLALSYSTFARYYTATKAVAQARISALRGINLSRRIGRNTALARIAFSEATRRYAQELGTPDERRIELFDQAAEALEDALKGLREPNLLIEALVEQACLYRDRMRYVESGKKQMYFELAEEKFQEVYKKASEQKPPNKYRMADAMSNRIWLGMFKQDEEFVKTAINQFESMDIFPCKIAETGALVAYKRYIEQNGKDPLVQFVGKSHIAHGTLVLGEDGQLAQDEAQGVALYWMLGLEYSHLFGSSYRGLSAAEEHIYNKVRKFNEQEIAWLFDALDKAEQSEGIEKRKSYLRILIDGTFRDDDEN